MNRSNEIQCKGVKGFETQSVSIAIKIARRLWPTKALIFTMLSDSTDSIDYSGSNCLSFRWIA